MSPEKVRTPEEPDGVRWLKMLGRGDLIGSMCTLKDGRVVAAQDFADACPEYAIDMLYAMEQLGPEHPLYIENEPTAQHAIESYLGVTHQR